MIITIEQANAACNLAARWYYQYHKQPYRKWAGEGVYKSRMDWFLAGFDVAALTLGLDQSLALCALWSRCMQETGAAWYQQEQKPDEDCETDYGWQSSRRFILGNDQPGDGARYKGRGIIQLTGKAQYRKAGDFLGVDFVSNPELVIEPSHAGRIVHWYLVVEMPSRNSWCVPYQWMLNDALSLEARCHRLAACINYGFYQPWNNHPAKEEIHGWQNTLWYGQALAQVLGLL